MTSPYCRLSFLSLALAVWLSARPFIDIRHDGEFYALQALLHLPEPSYCHHGLIMGGDGQKLSKSLASKPLRLFREEGATASDIRRMMQLGNIVMALILGHGHEDLNIKSAWLHVLGDTRSSVGVIVSGVVVYLTGWTYADPLAGVLIGFVIIIGGFRVVREASGIFLEMVPRGFHVETIAKRISEINGVMGIHDIHVWSLAHKRIAFTAHIWGNDQKLSELEPLRKQIEAMLREFRINHILLQFECAECETNALYCQVLAEEELHRL